MQHDISGRSVLLNQFRLPVDWKKYHKVKTEEDDNAMTSLTDTPYPTCGICLDNFMLTHSPISASLSANSSNRLPFGLRLPCPQGHSYCISCLTSYIQNKLDPDGRGAGKSSSIVFPIRCPECPPNEWPEGMQDDVAVKVLGEDGMVEWVSILYYLKYLKHENHVLTSIIKKSLIPCLGFSAQILNVPR